MGKNYFVMRGCGGGGGWEEGTRQWLTAHVFGVRRRDTSCGSRIKKLLGPGSDVDGDTAGVCNYDVSCRVCVCVCVGDSRWVTRFVCFFMFYCSFLNTILL